MSIEVDTRSRVRFFARNMRRFLSTSDPERSSDAVALVSTTPVPHVHGMFQDARYTNIRRATFNIYASGSSTSAPPLSEPTNLEQSTTGPSITDLPVLTNLIAVSAGSVLPADPIPTPQTSPEIYARHLITKNRGYPLWIPSPNMRLSASYRASGVRIGDVGIITPEGGFSFLFNVFHHSTHPINASMQLPDDFVPFTRDTLPSQRQVDEFKESSAGSYLGDESLVRLDNGDDRYKTILRTSAAHAAVLMMPEPVYASKLQSTVLLRKYVRDNIKSWYSFVKTVLGREVDNGDLRVVYGCRKSAAFGIATVSNSSLGSSADTSSTELTFSIDDSWIDITGCKYGWHHRGSAEAKVGPSLDENEDVQRERDTTRSRNLEFAPVINQCLFVSTIDFTLPEDEWKHIERGDAVSATRASDYSSVPSASGSHSSESRPSPASSGGSQSSLNHPPVAGSGQTNGTGTIDSQATRALGLYDSANWPSISPAKRLFHPSDVLAEFLLRVVPHATSVALCSDDWGPCMTDSVQTVAELIDHVLSANDLCKDNGMIYLSPKNCAPLTDFPESANALATTTLLVEWCRQNNLWPFSLVLSSSNEDTSPALQQAVQEVVDLSMHLVEEHSVQRHVIAAGFENVKVHKELCSEIASRCLSLMTTLEDASEGLEVTKMVEITDEIEAILQRMDRKIREWVSMNQLQSFLAQQEIKDGIDSLNRDIDEVTRMFNFKMNTKIARGQVQSQAIKGRDRAELRWLLRQVVSNQDNMRMLLDMQHSHDSHPVEEIMESLQTELMSASLDRIEAQAFKVGLWELYETTGKLPPLTDLTGQVDIGPQMTRGTFNDIFSGQWLDKETVALRLPRAIANSPDDQLDFQKEVSLWRGLSHENVIPLYGVIYQNNNLYCISPWMDNGSVSDYVKTNPTVDRLKLLTDAAMGLEYLHQNQIIHGDVKGDNLLISKNGTARLSDFGFSKFLENCGKSIGTANNINPRWFAPELLQQTGPVSIYSDVWSFAMLCLEVISGQPPYAKFNRDVAVLREVDNGRLPDHPGSVATQNGLSDPMWKLMQKCWSLKPESRPSITEVKNSILAFRGLMGLPREGEPPEGSSKQTLSKVSGIFLKSSMRPGIAGSKVSSSSRSTDRISTSGLLAENTLSPLDVSMKSIRETVRSDESVAYRNERRHSVSSMSASSVHPLQPPSPSSAMSVRSASNRSAFSRFSTPPTSPGSLSHHFPDLQSPTESSGDLSGPAREAVTDPRMIVNLNEAGTVASGTLEGFVQRLINQITSRKDSEFRQVFFTACADFTTPEDLFGLLSRRFFDVESDQSHPPKDKVLLQYNIFLVVRYWLSNRDLHVNHELLWQMKSFCETAMMKNSVSVRDKAREVLDIVETRRYKNTLTPPPLSPGRVKLSTSQILPTYLAIALALLEGDKYKALVPADYIAHLRGLPGYYNLDAFHTTNNKITYWVKDSILHYEKVEKRTEVLKFFIHTADECLKRRNFSSLVAIASALNSAPIDRLKLTKAGLTLELKKKIEFFKSIMDPSSNHRGYRDALNYAATPQERDQCIPWLAIHLKELHHVLQRYPTTVDVQGQPMINFERYVKFMDRVREVAHYKPPNLEPYRSEGYLDYLETQLHSVNISPDSDYHMMIRSKMIEARETLEHRTRKVQLRTLGFRLQD